MNAVEKILVSLDRTYMGALYRIAIGFVLIPLFSFVGLNVRSGWSLSLALLAVLLSLRILPAVARKLLALSAVAKAIWFERRQIAKRYDSYQWQKLFFVGLGLASYVLASKEWHFSRIVVSSVCVGCGAVGCGDGIRQEEVRRNHVHKDAIYQATSVEQLRIPITR